MNEIVMLVIVGVIAVIAGLLIGRLVFAQTKNHKEIAQREAAEVLLLSKKDAELFLQKAKNEADVYKKTASLK